MKKILLILTLALTVAVSNAAMLGETYQQLCAEYGKQGFRYANGWYTFPSLDLNRSHTYCQFYNNHLECIIFAGPNANWHFLDPMGDMYVTAGGRSFQEVAPANELRRFISYDKAVVAGLKNNNLLIVGWTDWMKQYGNKPVVQTSKVHHHHVTAPKHRDDVPAEVGEVLPPYLQ